MSDDLSDLETFETRQVLRFLLHRMGMDTRGKLMAEMPIAYAKLYPSAKEATLDRVRDALYGARKGEASA